MSANSNMLRQLAEAMLDWDGELSAEIKTQESSKTPCLRPEINEALEMMGSEFLSETLKLDSKTFTAVYQIKEFSLAERHQLHDTITEHVRLCERCQFVAQRGKWLDEKMDGFIKQKKQLLRELLTDDKKSITVVEPDEPKKTSWIFSDFMAQFDWRIARRLVSVSQVAFVLIALMTGLFFAVYQWQDSTKAPAIIVAENDNEPNAAQLETLETNNQISGRESKKTVFRRTAKEKKRRPQRLRLNNHVRHELVAQVRQIDLDDYPTFRRSNEPGDQRERAIKISASRETPTLLPLRLPERSKKGWYEITILEPNGMKTLVKERVQSKDGKTLAAKLDLRKLAEDEYYLSVSRQGETPRFYPIMISNSKSNRKTTKKPLSDPPLQRSGQTSTPCCESP